MENKFVGRDTELELLDSLWHSPRATFLIVYGRRRVGKTRLLAHWLNLQPERGLYWVAEPTSALEQLRSFTQALYNYDTPDVSAPQDYTFGSWEQALREVAKLAHEKRFALFIDEITYLMDVNPNFVGILQKAWDQWLSRSNLMLALSGSQMGLMQKNVLSYQAPLYGRTTAQVQLPPMPFMATKSFFPNYNAADRVSTYAVWGGIPAYWERLKPDLPFWENVRLQLLPSNMWMMDEPSFLLKDFVNDPYNYVSILRAIAQGTQTVGQIAKRTGLTTGHISSYLNTLRETGFVERQVPVTEAETDSRRGRYFITDPYLRFYYHFLAAYQSKLALGAQDELLEAIKEKLPAFIQGYTWRELCSQWILLASASGQLPVPVERVGGFWQHSQEVDLVGIDRLEKSLVLAACEWGTTPAGSKVMQELVKKTAAVVPDDDSLWSVYYLGFSTAGWEDDVCEKTERLTETRQKGKNWQSAGVRLLDLPAVDRDLAAWSD
ncbi:MAG: ATP-binding protein [Chloroflexi bacterium]|nr:ATP-binding protein [Chloroflexota bacterium]MCI0649928.1 ATP-binding protein [Chloroflexota bacterium]MCI0729841.1 ATP-binding protein [Chloroflexota bacterium]